MGSYPFTFTTGGYSVISPGIGNNSQQSSQQQYDPTPHLLGPRVGIATYNPCPHLRARLSPSRIRKALESHDALP